MKLQIPPLSQRDVLWKDAKLGTSTTTTIGQAGCLLVCHSMMLSYYGHDFHPDDLNAFYKTRGVFANATLIDFWKAANCFDDIKADEYIDCYDTPAPLDKIDKYLQEGKPVIAMVDFSPTTGVQTHFVLIVGKEGDYLINDPWTGETYYFTAKYGDPATKIFGLRLYSGPVKEVGASVESLNAKITELSNKLAEEIKETAELRTININLQADNADAEKRNSLLVEENRKLVMDSETQKITIIELEEQYHKSQKELQETLSDLAEQNKLMIGNLSTAELCRELIRRFLRK
jgi:hypothetical protein